MRPIVWNRCSALSAGRALVVVDHEADPRRCTLILDPGPGPVVYGVRDVVRGEAGERVLAAWRATAAEHGLAWEDERRSEPVRLADGPAEQRLIEGVRPVDPTAYDLALLARRRQQRRGGAPLPAGGLFDQVGRDQQDLF
jgi:hypothetical protein